MALSSRDILDCALCDGAVDLAGNQAVARSVSYSVVYPFEWLSDYKPYPRTNRIFAGGPLYLRFSLDGDNGLNVPAAGSPAWQWRSCSSGQQFGDLVPAQLIHGLYYVDGAGYYQMVVLTRGDDLGRCADLILTLTDGTQHALRVQFTRDR